MTPEVAFAPTTLHAIVRPLPQEALTGLMWRADLANEWPAGTVVAMVAKHRAGRRRFHQPALSVIGTTMDLPALAVLLGLPEEAVVATTLREQLRRLFGPDVTAKRLGVIPGLRICPECIRESRLLPLEILFPAVDMCSRHHVLLRTWCDCGYPFLEPGPNVTPFECTRCGRAWGTLRTRRVEPAEDLLQRQLAHAYEVILARGDETLLDRAKRLLVDGAVGRWDGGWTVIDGRLRQVAAHKRFLEGLSAVVATLVAQQVAPERLFEDLPEPSEPPVTCLNRACRTYGTDETTHRNGWRLGQRESYCAACGSRFLDDRILQCFDFENGSPTLERWTVERARARLAVFTRDVGDECRKFVAEGRPLTIRDVFHDAGVPQHASYRAPRLGLVAIIDEWAGRPVDDRLLPPGGSARWSSE